MANTYLGSIAILKNMVIDQILSGEDFIYEEMCDKVLDKEGFLKFNFDYTIQDYLKELVGENIIFMNPFTHKYQVCFEGLEVAMKKESPLIDKLAA
jgi:hypothetical protein